MEEVLMHMLFKVACNNIVLSRSTLWSWP